MNKKNKDRLAPPGYRIYPYNSVPEFKIVKKSDGTLEQRVRYVSEEVGYTGLWMVVPIEEEN